MAETRAQDAIALLKQGHRDVADLFADFAKASGDGRKQRLAHEICLALSVHFALEEEIFYPACEGEVKDDQLKEGYVEHDAAKLLVAEIEANEGGGDDFFDSKVHVLQEEIEHHVKEEEKPGGIFAQAREAKLDLDALGEQLAARKNELTERFEASGIPKPELTTMDEVAT
jgi:hypothetical protein